MTERVPEHEGATPERRDEFTAESEEQDRFVDDAGGTQVTRVRGEDSFTTDDGPAVPPDEVERSTPLPGGLVQ